MENKISVDAVKLARRVVVEVEVRRIRELRLRLWVAKHVLRFGCWIGNMTLKENEVVGVLITEKPEVPSARVSS